MTVRIQVPATSANLGPGFDILGLALQFYNRFEAKASNELSVSVLPGTCVDVTYLNLDPTRNIVARAYNMFFEKTGRVFIPAQLGIEAHVPLARGLGSSSTAIVAGVVLANHLSGKICSQADLLTMAIELEGHPDNVTPALLGGLHCCWPESFKQAQKSLQLKWPENWGLIFVVPPTALSTKASRNVLPATYMREAIRQAQCALALWIEAVQTQNVEQLSRALRMDSIHQPYRKPLIPEWAVVDDILEDSDALGCVLSGAGSTLLIMTPNEKSTATLKESLSEDPRLEHCKIMRLKPDLVGACLI